MDTSNAIDSNGNPIPNDHNTPSEHFSTIVGPIISAAYQRIQPGFTPAQVADEITKDLPPAWKVAILSAAFPTENGSVSAHVIAIRDANGKLWRAWDRMIASSATEQPTFGFEEILESPESPLGRCAHEEVIEKADRQADEAQDCLGDRQPT